MGKKVLLAVFGDLHGLSGTMSVGHGHCPMYMARYRSLICRGKADPWFGARSAPSLLHRLSPVIPLNPNMFGATGETRPGDVRKRPGALRDTALASAVRSEGCKRAKPPAATLLPETGLIGFRCVRAGRGAGSAHGGGRQWRAQQPGVELDGARQHRPRRRRLRPALPDQRGQRRFHGSGIRRRLHQRHHYWRTLTPPTACR